MSVLKKLFGVVEAPPELNASMLASEEGIGAIRKAIPKHWDAAFTFLNEQKARGPRMENVDLLRACCFLEKRQRAAAVEALKEELRWFPENKEAVRLLEQNAIEPKEELPNDAEFRELHAAIRPATMLSVARLYSLFTQAKRLCADDLPGNFVECGVAAGGSSAMLAAVIARHSKRSRKLFSCDTFEGMPEPDARDTHRGVGAHETGWGAGTCSAPMQSLLNVSRQLRAEHIVEPVQGLFADTLPKNAARFGDIALLHMDGDWYSSTRDILTNLFDQVVPGGAIQIDDYGFWEGCRRAVTEFEQERGLRFQLHTIDETGVWMVK